MLLRMCEERTKTAIPHNRRRYALFADAVF